MAGGGPIGDFLFLLLGASSVYIGGMYLNDAFDAEFDAAHRSERPIPAGLIPQRLVSALGWMWLAIGLLGMGLAGTAVAPWALALAGAVVAYDIWHKKISWAPVLMAACRFFLYLAAAASGRYGLTSLAIWGAVVLFAYIVGLSYLARSESFGDVSAWWPLLLLAGPLILAVPANRGWYFAHTWPVALVFALWTIRSISFAWTSRKIGKAVSGLLAGIVLVDMLNCAALDSSGLLFILFFLASLLFQRFIPAT